MLIRNNTGRGGEVSIGDMDFIGTFQRMAAAENIEFELVRKWLRCQELEI